MRSSISSQSRDTWLLETPFIPMALTMIVNRAGRDALDIGFLDHGGQRLLAGHPARLQKARKIRALAQFWDPQHDRAGPRLRVARPIAGALDKPLGALLAMPGAGQRGCNNYSVICNNYSAN